MTWVPQLLMFLFQSYLVGGRWFIDNLWIASAIFIASVVWILLLALLSQAISALVKWRVIASATLLGLFFIPSVFGEVVNLMFRTRWGNLISLGALTRNISAGLFGTFESAATVITDMNGEGISRVVLSENRRSGPPGQHFLRLCICLASSLGESQSVRGRELETLAIALPIAIL